HGLVAFQNKIHRRTRRGRSLIDRRSAAGKKAVAIDDKLLADLGGHKKLLTGKTDVDRDGASGRLLLRRDRPADFQVHLRGEYTAAEVKEKPEIHFHALLLPPGRS